MRGEHLNAQYNILSIVWFNGKHFLTLVHCFLPSTAHSKLSATRDCHQDVQQKRGAVIIRRWGVTDYVRPSGRMIRFDIPPVARWKPMLHSSRFLLKLRTYRSSEKAEILAVKSEKEANRWKSSINQLLKAARTQSLHSRTVFASEASRTDDCYQPFDAASMYTPTTVRH